MKKLAYAVLIALASPAVTATVAYFGVWRRSGEPPCSYVEFVWTAYDILFRLFS